MKLTIEQEFELRRQCDVFDRMSHEQCKATLKYLMEQLLIQKNYYDEIVKKAWGLESLGGKNE